jgi:hypothetical protein
MGFVKRLAIGLFVSVLLATLVLGYLGFIPVLSDLMGSNTPRDLGVSATAISGSSINSKIGVTFTTLPSSNVGRASVVETGSQQKSLQLTSEEVTALVNDHASKWKYYPIEKVQVRINQDNSIELSGVLRVDRWSGYADAIMIPESTRALVRPYLGYVPTNPSIYIKGTLDVRGYPIIQISELQIGKVSIPADQANNYAGVLESFTSYVSDLYQLNISQLYSQGGSLVVVAILPTNVALSPPVESQTGTSAMGFWAPNRDNALRAFGFVTLVYIVGHLLRAQLSAVWEKLNGLLPSAAQMWIENYISSKSDVAVEAVKGTIFKITKVELIAYLIALVMLTIAFSYTGTATLQEMLVAIPLVLATSVLIEFLKNYVLNVFSRSRRVWAEYRIWPPGLFMFLVSAFVFKTPFSSPSKSGQNEGEKVDTVGGLIAVNSVLIVLALGGVFYYLKTQGISNIGNIGLGMCLLSTFFDSLPIPPLNGKEIWDWSKVASILLLAVTLALNLYWIMIMS